MYTHNTKIYFSLEKLRDLKHKMALLIQIHFILGKIHINLKLIYSIFQARAKYKKLIYKQLQLGNQPYLLQKIRSSYVMICSLLAKQHINQQYH
jgi:hypothetical protein